MSEARERYLTTIGEDCLAILGPGSRIIVVDQQVRQGASHLVVRYELQGAAGATEASGSTVVEAHAALRRQLVVDRVAMGMRRLIAP